MDILETPIEEHRHTLTPSVKARLRRDAWRFDLYALVALLEYYGVDMQDVVVKGHFGFESQPRFIRSLDFDANDTPVITLYFGLAGADSMLPSYFFRMAESGVFNELHFHQLIGFLDRYLLKTWLNALTLQPIANQREQEVWLRSMQNLTNMANLAWLFELVMPELQVRVERIERTMYHQSRPARVGVSKIGHEMILGDRFSIPGYCHRVTLIVDEEYYKPEQPWHEVVPKRYEALITPLLQGLDIFLEIWLVVRSTQSWVTLQERGNYLGYERIKGMENQHKKVLIRSGYIH